MTLGQRAKCQRSHPAIKLIISLIWGYVKITRGVMMNKNNITPIDKIDRSLIEILENDGRTSSDKLARQLNISSASVRRRLRALLHEKVIKIVAITDLKKIGIDLMVAIDMEINHKTVDSAIDVLVRHEAVVSVGLTQGRFNCAMFAIFSNTDEFQDFMRTVIFNLKGLITMESYFFLEFKKGRFVYRV